MNITQAIRVLAECQAFDNRDVGQTNAIAWANALGNLPLGVALEAVTEHYRQSPSYAMPADILRIARDPAFRAQHRPHPSPLAELEDIQVATPERIAEIRAQYQPGHRQPRGGREPAPIGDLLGSYQPTPLCSIEECNQYAADDGLCRRHDAIYRDGKL